MILYKIITLCKVLKLKVKNLIIILYAFNILGTIYYIFSLNNICI
jgi:hypothetical protein